MKRLLCYLVLSFTVMTTFTSNTAKAGEMGTKNKGEVKKVDWNPVMDAIIQVESGGNKNAVSGNSVGVMQITPICVAECNRILQTRNIAKRFKLSDRYNVAKSKEMFLIIQSFFNPNSNIEFAIRAWNGGARFKIKSTQKYYEKVLRVMNK